jgi:molecular chaperone DnaK/molecular chaperone HscA
MVAGLPRIEVKFLIDANGILHVSAREQRSGKESEIEVKPTYGLTDEQVETMILASFDHAEEDIEARQLIEARNEAETILGAVEKGKQHVSWLQLSSYEMSTIEMEIGQLKQAMQGDNYRAIRQGIERLDKSTRRFAELMMDTEVMGAMKGQTMSEAGASMGEGPTAPHPFAKAEFDEDDQDETNAEEGTED